MRTLGILLIIVGILALALPYITFTTKEKVFDAGPIEAVTEREQRIPVSPIVATVVLLAGAGIVASTVLRKAV